VPGEIFHAGVQFLGGVAVCPEQIKHLDPYKEIVTDTDMDLSGERILQAITE
jgi:hypothetical protein